MPPEWADRLTQHDEEPLYGMLAGYPLNHKSTGNSITNAKDMARGRIFLCSNRATTKVGHSP